eukprot:TRINITY_DN3169_c0_g1_i1.p1 TRINITY_DN3169_c0_g1~~TRINITY_DN3169_c0_g1_i1.p1  ORF type:complete len:676 (-),score=129.97 TRINITY_DN3169_c0_g1_i1:117-2144(-)
MRGICQNLILTNECFYGDICVYLHTWEKMEISIPEDLKPACVVNMNKIEFHFQNKLFLHVQPSLPNFILQSDELIFLYLFLYISANSFQNVFQIKDVFPFCKEIFETDDDDEIFSILQNLIDSPYLQPLKLHKCIEDLNNYIQIPQSTLFYLLINAYLNSEKKTHKITEPFHPLDITHVPLFDFTERREKKKGKMKDIVLHLWRGSSSIEKLSFGSCRWNNERLLITDKENKPLCVIQMPDQVPQFDEQLGKFVISIPNRFVKEFNKLYWIEAIQEPKEDTEYDNYVDPIDFFSSGPPLATKKKEKRENKFSAFVEYEEQKMKKDTEDWKNTILTNKVKLVNGFGVPLYSFCDEYVVPLTQSNLFTSYIRNPYIRTAEGEFIYRPSIVIGEDNINFEIECGNVFSTFAILHEINAKENDEEPIIFVIPLKPQLPGGLPDHRANGKRVFVERHEIIDLTVPGLEIIYRRIGNKCFPTSIDHEDSGKYLVFYISHCPGGIITSLPRMKDEQHSTCLNISISKSMSKLINIELINGPTLGKIDNVEVGPLPDAFLPFQCVYYESNEGFNKFNDEKWINKTQIEIKDLLGLNSITFPDEINQFPDENPIETKEDNITTIFSNYNGENLLEGYQPSPIPPEFQENKSIFEYVENSVYHNTPDFLSSPFSLSPRFTSPRPF